MENYWGKPLFGVPRAVSPRPLSQKNELEGLFNFNARIAEPICHQIVEHE